MRHRRQRFNPSSAFMVACLLVAASVASNAWSAVIRKGSVIHPGGNFCTNGSVPFVASGGDVVLIYRDQLPYNGVPMSILPAAPQTQEFFFSSGGVSVTVRTYLGLTPGQPYTLSYSVCGQTPSGVDAFSIIEDGCSTVENPQAPFTCRWQASTNEPILDFGRTVLVGQSFDRTLQLINDSSQALNGGVGIGCPEFSIVGNPIVSIPGFGQTTITVRYAPTLENTAIGELTPSCAGTLVLGSAIGPRLWVTTGTTTLRRHLDGTEDIETFATTANHRDIAFDVGNVDVYIAAQWTSGDVNDGIYKGNLDSQASRIVTVANPWSVDVDPVAGKIYWGANGTIQRANTNGTSVENLPTPITFDAASPVDLVIDSQARLLYWTEGTSTITIRRATLDGAGEVTLATITGGGNPRLAFHRAAGRLYWSENTTGRIRRIHTDGTNKQTLFTPESITPVSLVVDPADGKLYWSDAGTGSVHRVDLGGENHQEIVTGISGPTGLALIRLPAAETERVFWTDNVSDHVGSVLKDGTSFQTPVSSGLTEARGMAVDVGAGKMYWVDQGIDRIRRANLDGSGVQDLVTTGLNTPQDVALDLDAGKLYWTDSAFQGAVQIKRANLDGTSVENVHGSAAYGVRGIALDPVNGTMYWSQVETGTPAIYRATLNGAGTQVFLSAQLTYPPLDIEIDVDGGKIYWTEATTSGQVAGLVRRANLDGSGIETLYSASGDDGRIRSIALDLGARKVYWTSLSAIRRRNLDGSGGGFGLAAAENVRTGLVSAQGVAVAVRAGYPTPTDVDDGPTVGPRVHLEVPRPNPFNPSTHIAYTHAGGELSVAIYDVRGRLVRTLFAGRRAAGRGSMQWDGNDQRGNVSPSGLYFVRMRSQQQERTEKAVLVR